METKKTDTRKKTKPAPKSKTVTAERFTETGSKMKPIALPRAVFTASASPKLLAQAVRVYLINKRQGTQSTKTRGEVTGSTRKIYRQKGTGRARHGSIKAPIFVGGGITFGPKPRDFTAGLPKKMRRKALRVLLSQKAKAQEISVISGLGKLSGKTKDMNMLLQKLNVTGKKLLLVIGKDMINATRGARNIENVTVRPVSSLSLLDVIASEYIVYAEEALVHGDKTESTPTISH